MQCALRDHHIGDGEAFGSIAEARGVAAGVLWPTTDYVDAGPVVPKVLVYRRGVSGSSTEGPVATLSDPSDDVGFLSVAISPDARVIAALVGGGEKVDVFVRPLAGWAEAVAPAAQLHSPNGRPLVGQVSFAGSAIVTSTYGPPARPSPGDTFVFPEPAGGWGSADLTPAALEHSGKPSSRAAHHGPWVIITRPKGADVYAERADGWKGVVHQVGFLAPDKQFDGFPVYYAPLSAVIGEDAFSEPTRGWIGTIRPVARLAIHGLSRLGEAAIDGSVVAISSYQLGSEHKCPCSATMATAARPVHRHRASTFAAPPSARVTTALGPPYPVLDGQTLLVGGAQSIPVYALRPSRTAKPCRNGHAIGDRSDQHSDRDGGGVCFPRNSGPRFGGGRYRGRTKGGLWRGQLPQRPRLHEPGFGIVVHSRLVPITSLVRSDRTVRGAPFAGDRKSGSRARLRCLLLRQPAGPAVWVSLRSSVLPMPSCSSASESRGP